MSAVQQLSDEASYDAAINGELPVLVDFTATWCGPCKQLAPVLDEMSVELKDRLTIVKVDIDESKDIAGRYTIQGVPTMMLFERGELLATMIGAKPKRELLATIEPLLP
jgi:thioredoxin 1